ncbi:hypothetical protein C0Q70_16459 [Pomacea canaliculata]|uniref:Uncharacterized protein n=1 Tax=Pomacea canaliculata TaxID=400727 RepID=A0A2T7NPW8_POMCA|nr:hypothetical protein C0Q70_16459 [Pomacea canaliculata]
MGTPLPDFCACNSKWYHRGQGHPIRAMKPENRGKVSRDDDDDEEEEEEEEEGGSFIESGTHSQ